MLEYYFECGQIKEKRPFQSGIKSGSGKDAPKWFRDGQIERVIEYCKDDVDITRRIYEHIKEYGYVDYKDLRGRNKRCQLTLQAET